jgi:hypothetical protein
MMQESAGAGVSNRSEDNIVPSLKVLQPMSPELEPDSGVENARAGDFLLGGKVIAGKEGVWFQPCHQDHKLFEFVDLERGGGFVAEHPIKRDEGGDPAYVNGDLPMPTGAIKTDRFSWGFENGNQLVHYRHMAGIAWVDGAAIPCVIPFKSTGHTVAKKWMSKARTANPFPNGKQRAIFSHLYKVTSLHRRNTKGQWFEVDVGDPVCLDPRVSPAVLEIVSNPTMAMKMGMDLNKAFISGERAAETPSAVPNEGEASDAM